jgi:hypothetical protein
MLCADDALYIEGVTVPLQWAIEVEPGVSRVYAGEDLAS